MNQNKIYKMFNNLKIYKNKGHFFFMLGQKLSDVCNAHEKREVILFVRSGKVKKKMLAAKIDDAIKTRGFSETGFC